MKNLLHFSTSIITIKHKFINIVWEILLLINNINLKYQNNLFTLNKNIF
ncbi:hypothetical protein EU91_1192 [Prochlorococcus marinus str. GP2]|uniref:Uncharacterized protein n=1 Tax=Prochlorococcus marinus str. GP2 TaxID=59925 RepID=A0A0A1ZD11_PROMR|nr:hypothetical protein EU91_1192 [Prochlorococcus marinus str. GP2]